MRDKLETTDAACDGSDNWNFGLQTFELRTSDTSKELVCEVHDSHRFLGSIRQSLSQLPYDKTKVPPSLAGSTRMYRIHVFD